MANCRNETLNLSEPPTDLSPEAELERKVYHYFMEIGVPVVCAFGLIGNILNLMVLTRQKIHCSLTKMEKSAHIGLIALAVSDFMFCFLALLFTILPTEDTYTQLDIVVYYHWLGGSFITIFIITSTWLIVVMAGERYLAVCHPFKARKFISLKKTRVTTLTVYFLCICISVPLFFENVLTETHCVNNTLIYQIEPRKEFGKHLVALRRLIWAVLFDFIPCAALLYFNACLIWKIHKAKKLRKQMAPGQGYSPDMVVYRATSRSNNTNTEYTQLHQPHKSASLNSRNHNNHELHAISNEHKNGKRISLVARISKPKRRHSDNALNSVTATLVAVVVLFLILVSPSEILKFIYLKIKEDSTGVNHTYRMIRSVTNFMQALNFSVNFVLYCAVNKSFRETLTGFFCFCYKDQVRLLGSCSGGRSCLTAKFEDLS